MSKQQKLTFVKQYDDVPSECGDISYLGRLCKVQGSV